MIAVNPHFDLQEVYNRAASIRVCWTPSERRRRAGLPPDLPSNIRNMFLAEPQLQPAFNYSISRRGSR
jgi:hypothetical protein